MINFGLAREIYGNNLWMVDNNTFGALWQTMIDFRNNVNFESTSDKMNSFGLYDVKNVGFINDGYSSSDDSELINIINLNGVITKNGGQSTNGTKQMAAHIRKSDADSRVKGHIIRSSSGGGSGNAIEIMTDAIKSAKKPVYAFIEKGDISASACYGIISACDKIVSESPDNEVGSLGTFIQFSGFPKNTTDSDGMKHLRIYATKSTQKNINFEEAINNDNFEPIIEDLLNPANEKFLSSIQENRPNITEEHKTGAMFKCGDVLGSMVDSIGAFDDVVSEILNSNQLTLNNSKMTLQELKQNHSDLCEQIRNEGVMAERDRVGSWMAHATTDLEAVKNGISEGNSITQTQMQEFFVKQNNLNGIASMKNDSAPDVVVDESANAAKSEEVANQKEIDALYGEGFNA